MLPRQAPQRDLSQTAGNPTHAIHQNYQQLMAIQDPEELRQAVVELVQPLVGRGMSVPNYKRFENTLGQLVQRGLVAVQNYVTQFMMKGAGEGVLRVGRESCEIDALASMLTEDADVFVALPPRLLALKEMVESYGYVVVVDELALAALNG